MAQPASHADPPGGPRAYRLDYRLTADAVEIEARCDAVARLVLPIVCTQGQSVERLSPRAIRIARDGGPLVLDCDAPAAFEAVPERRVFNLVPGFQCAPIAAVIEPGRAVRVTIRPGD